MTRKASLQYNLQTKSPEIAKEWHPTKNNNIKPTEVTPGSPKKYWWMCNHGHEWETSINQRTNSRSGCPFCSGLRATQENSLAKINQNLASEWHPTKNDKLSPKDITPRSNKKVWWLCKKGHEWQTDVANRAAGNGCPYCSGLRATHDNSFAALRPDELNEWHPTKNEGLDPWEITVQSSKNVWWKCKRGHEWKTKITHRASGSGCPFCNSMTSRDEIRIYVELKYIFYDIQHRTKISGIECDMFLPSLKLAVEFDGVYWHKNKYEKDKNKNKVLRELGVRILRIREEGLRTIENSDIIVPIKNKDFSLIRRILDFIEHAYSFDLETSKKVGKYLKDGIYKSNKEYEELLFALPGPGKDKSLANLFPELEKEWNYGRNVNLSPYEVYPKSSLKVWWKCKIGHEWQINIYVRANGAGCPYCSGLYVTDQNKLSILKPAILKFWNYSRNKYLLPESLSIKSTKYVWWICEKGHEWKKTINHYLKNSECPICFVSTNNLQIKNPILASEWHPSKNGLLKPIGISYKSNLKVWWVCEKGHEWSARISDRSNGNGCPYCGNKKIVPRNRSFQMNNSLQDTFPQFASQWHPTKNGDLKPSDVVYGSGRKIYWACPKGHEWEKRVIDYVKNSTCPTCYISENNLQNKNPKLASEWHPLKNGTNKVGFVLPNSGKKAWWICKTGHEWQASIGLRNKGNGCPYCAKILLSKENSLAIKNPELSKEWHPVKNGELTPSLVFPGSIKKAWWLCKNGHEWEASIGNRHRFGSGCPYCRRIS